MSDDADDHHAIEPLVVTNADEYLSFENQKGITIYDNNIARASSVYTAIMIRRFVYLHDKYKKLNRGWFFIVPETFCNVPGIPIYAFRKEIKEWEKRGLVETTLKGLPLKKWYRCKTHEFAIWVNTLKRLGAHLIENANLTSTTFPHLNEFDKIASPKRQDKVPEFDKILSKNISKIKDTRITRSQVRENVLVDLSLPIKTFFDKCASRLFDTIQKNLKITPTTNFKNWAKEFKALHQQGVDDKRMRNVLIWYCQHMDEKFVPVAHSAKSFREKFTLIESARARSKAPKEETPPEPEKVTNSKLIELIEFVENLGWGPGTSSIRQCVIDSWKNFKAWEKRDEEIRPTLKKEIRETIREWDMTYNATGCFSVLQIWFENRKLDVENWNDWKGHTRGFIWSINNNYLQKEAIEYVTEYSGSDNHWQRYMKALLAKNEN